MFKYSRTAKLLAIESLRCSSQTNMSGIVFWTANRPKIPILPSIFHSEDRNMSVFCPLGLSGSTNMRGIWGGPASGFICIPAGAGPWDIRADKIPTSEFQIRIRYRPFCYPIKPGCPPDTYVSFWLLTQVPHCRCRASLSSLTRGLK